MEMTGGISRIWMMLALAMCAMFATLPRPAAGCMCQSRHPQEYACSADFVIIAKISSINEEGMNLRYGVDVKRFFKASDEGIKGLKTLGLLSSRYDSMCGVQLTRGELYLIMGRMWGGQAHLSLCDYYRPWSKVSVRQRKGVRLQYKLSCACKVEQCPWWRRHDWDVQHCLSEHSVCMPDSQGGCNWLKGQPLDFCMRRAAHDP